MKELNVNTGELIYKRTVKLVKKWIKGNIWEKFTDYFEINNDQKSKRNKNLLLKVPKVRL